ncbi:hypothetical protein DSM104299_05356 [Baekduia alba]|uniref:DUF2304 domain-containing protein n=1 Tax=Baekduia alba TaxID=2997333 RepID=UPI002341B64C|nr:DUF2304 domain-containing protein [Baekduia alba]WCB96592.1 hypothetical protein DSM104299_05356 [Baekduia alba]
MQTRLQIISVLVSGGLFLFVFELVRRKRLLERYALLWLFAAAVLLALSVWGDLLNRISTAVGVQYGPAALFAVALGFVVVLMLHFSLVISKLTDQNKILAQRVALLERRMTRAIGESDEDDEPAQSGSDLTASR